MKSGGQVRLLLLTKDFPPSIGGVQRYLYNIFRRLPAADIMVLASQHPNGAEFDYGKPFSVMRLSRLTAWSLFSVMRRFEVDLVLCGHAHTLLLLVAWLYARAQGVPYGVFTYGNDFLAAQRRWYHCLFNRALRSADLVFAPSAYSRDQLVRLGPKKVKTIVVRPGVDSSRFRPMAHPRSHRPILLTVGRLVKRKGQDMVIRALPLVRAKFPAVRYIIVGQGAERLRLEKLAEQLGVRDCVTFAGPVDDGELPKYYNDCDVFVMPSREIPEEASVEAFGMVYLEASACGKPVIGGRSGGAEEAVVDGVTGLLVDPWNIEELAETINRLLSDEDFARDLGENGQRWVKKQMNWERAAQEVKEAILRLGLTDMSRQSVQA